MRASYPTCPNACRPFSSLTTTSRCRYSRWAYHNLSCALAASGHCRLPGGFPVTQPSLYESPSTEKKIYQIYRDYFDRAEKKRRWSVRDGIPWDRCNHSLDPAIGDL